MHYMELGGAERALLGLLYAIDTNKVDVDLFINQHTGPFMSLIPSKINLLPQHPIYSAIERPMKDIIMEGHWGVAWGRLLSKWRYSRYLKKLGTKNDATFMQFLYDGVICHLPSLKHLGHYDMAISFIDPPHIVQDKIDADVKVEWIHTDFSSRQRNYDANITYSRWAGNDYIVSISDEVTEAFLLAFPSLKNKIKKIENIIPRSLILEQVKEGICSEYQDVPDDVLKICSVGRLTYQKNFDNIPIIAKLLKQKGCSFHWWVVGPGDVNYYNQIAEQEGVPDVVSFLGARENPYPYMKNCDLYVQPSRWEGKAVTVQEAQMLARPVIITRYPTSSSQVVDGEDGIICEMDNESIANSILELSLSPKRMNKLGATAQKMHPGNFEEVENLYDMIF